MWRGRDDADTMNKPSFHTLRILETRDETAELTHVLLGGASSEFLQAHTTPGQYVQVESPGERPCYFAISSQPGNDAIELLFKRGTPVADYAIARKVEHTLSVTAPAGKGYPMQELRGHDILLAGVGSAMAPLRSAIQFILRDRAAYGAVDFYYGARGEGWVPYPAEIERWRAQGIGFHPAWSQIDADGLVTGTRVQDRIVRERLALNPRGAVLVCGMKTMVAEVTAACAQAGLPPERVFQNF